MEMRYPVRMCLLVFSIWNFTGKEVIESAPTVFIIPSNVVNADVGESLTITCKVEMDVNIASVNFLRDNHVQLYIFPICDFHPSDNNNKAYNVTCLNSKSFTMVQHNIDTNDHRKIWTCQILSTYGPCLSACVSNSVTVHVRVPVTTVQLTDQDDKPLIQTMFVTEGSNTTLRCNTSPNGSRSEVLFLWYKRHESQLYTLIDDQSIFPKPDPIQVPKQPETDLRISYSSLRFMPLKSNNSMYLRCAAKDNTFNSTVVGSNEVQINVQYSPTVRLYPNNTIYNVTEGTKNLMLNCNVIDANPKPRLNEFIWLKDGIVISGQNSASYTLQNVQRADDGEYRCKATNAIGTGSSETLTIQVQYAPKIYPLGQMDVEEGLNLEVTCNVSARPLPNVSWVRSGVERSASAFLKIPFISRAQSGNYACTALNCLHPTNQSPVNSNTSDILVVNVLYGPSNSTSLSTHSPLYTVEEGYKAEDIVCRATCNPDCSYRWQRHNETITSTNTLALGGVKRTNTGRYDCMAYNSIQGLKRQSTVSLEVIIKYAPDVMIQLHGSTIINTTATLICIPHGEPPKYTFHQWIHIVGQTYIRRLNGTNTDNSSTIILSNISFEDMGFYICTVDNSITGLNGQIKKTAHTYVYIQGPPVFGETERIFTGQTNRSARIEIPIYSNSSIKILNMTKGSNSSEINNTSETSISLSLADIALTFYTKKEMVSGYLAILFFCNLKDTDFDNYTLHLANQQGHNSLEFSLIASTEPSIPKKFVLSHLEGGLPVFEFKKGFNGGHKQTFVFEYQRIGMPEAKWTIILKMNETSLDHKKETHLINIPQLPDGHYIFRVYAENEKGHSSTTENVTVEIRQEMSPTGIEKEVLVPAVVGSIVAVVVVLAVVAVVVFVIKQQTERNTTESEIHLNSPRNNYFENPEDAYENAVFLGMNGAAFPAVDNDVYENGPIGRSQQPLINKDGLIYADLELVKPETRGGKPIIHGLENRTEYADIAFGRRGEPLADSDDRKHE